MIELQLNSLEDTLHISHIYISPLIFLLRRKKQYKQGHEIDLEAHATTLFSLKDTTRKKLIKFQIFPFNVGKTYNIYI